eukprot:jgi/Mesen1/6759/ME000344S06035
MQFSCIVGQVSKVSPELDSQSLPFFFYVKENLGTDEAVDGLEITVSNFQDDTWQACCSASELEEKRDFIGMRGTFDTFMKYVHDAFSSPLVSLLLKNGSGSATLVGQRDKGQPLVKVELETRDGADASRCMRALAMEQHSAIQRALALLAAGFLPSPAEVEEKDRQMEEAGVNRGAGGRLRRRSSQLRSSSASQALQLALSQVQQSQGANQVAAYHGFSQSQSQSQPEAQDSMLPSVVSLSKPPGTQEETRPAGEKKRPQKQPPPRRRLRQRGKGTTVVADDDDNDHNDDAKAS